MGKKEISWIGKKKGKTIWRFLKDTHEPEYGERDDLVYAGGKKNTLADRKKRGETSGLGAEVDFPKKKKRTAASKGKARAA